MFPVEIWGTVAAWVGSVGTTVSIAAAAFYYIQDKRAVARSQSSHVKIESSDPWQESLTIIVTNNSEQPIYDLSAYMEAISLRRMVLRPDLRSLWLGTEWEYTNPRHLYEYWSTNRGSDLLQWLIRSGPLASEEHFEFTFNDSENAAAFYWITYVDVRGQRWKVRHRTSKLKKVKRDPGDFFIPTAIDPLRSRTRDKFRRLVLVAHAGLLRLTSGRRDDEPDE